LYYNLLTLHVTKRGPGPLHPPPGMPDYDDLCDELTYDELTDGLSTCSGSVNDLLDQLGVEDYRDNVLPLDNMYSTVLS
jgi:hypothetical protein